MKCPTSWPATANRWWPSASISAARSLASVALSYPSWGLSVLPMPRWSTAMTSKSRASAGITIRQANQFSGQPCTSSSGGPSPPMTACWRSPLASMYRLLNVSGKPAGGVGAPETEPGPSGVDGGAEDELMRISLRPHGVLVLVTPPTLLVSFKRHTLYRTTRHDDRVLLTSTHATRPRPRAPQVPCAARCEVGARNSQRAP